MPRHACCYCHTGPLSLFVHLFSPHLEIQTEEEGRVRQEERGAQAHEMEHSCIFFATFRSMSMDQVWHSCSLYFSLLTPDWINRHLIIFLQNEHICEVLLLSQWLERLPQRTDLLILTSSLQAFFLLSDCSLRYI